MGQTKINCGSKKLLCPKKFGSTKILDPKKCWFQKNVSSKKTLGPEKFCVPRNEDIHFKHVGG